jgi:hypothetical protein
MIMSYVKTEVDLSKFWEYFSGHVHRWQIYEEELPGKFIPVLHLYNTKFWKFLSLHKPHVLDSVHWISCTKNLFPLKTDGSEYGHVFASDPILCN